jgi:hypothetical protein
MITDSKYTENATGEAVTVSTAWCWSDDSQLAIVTYAGGRRYALSYKQLEQHFSLVLPQEIAFQSFGTHTDRPTQQQRELEANGDSNT